MGLFTSADIEKAPKDSGTLNPATASTASTAQPVYSGTPNRKQILLGQVIATKSNSKTVTDNDMAMPDNWREGGDPTLGHQEDGRTVCVHSLAVLPAYQRKGLGTMLLKAYIQRIEASGLADRISLISHDPLVPFYEAMGFENQGPSKAQIGGGGWTDLV